MEKKTVYLVMLAADDCDIPVLAVDSYQKALDIKVDLNLWWKHMCRAMPRKYPNGIKDWPWIWEDMMRQETDFIIAPPDIVQYIDPHVLAEIPNGIYDVDQLPFYTSQVEVVL